MSILRNDMCCGSASGEGRVKALHGIDVGDAAIGVRCLSRNSPFGVDISRAKSESTASMHHREEEHEPAVIAEGFAAVKVSRISHLL